MPDKQLSLLLLGGSHIGESSDRFELTRQKFDTVDFVFIECVTDDESVYTKAKSSVIAPLIVLVAILVLAAESIANAIGKGDEQLKQQIVNEYDVEVIEVDGSFHPTINSSPYFWFLSNFALLFIVFVTQAAFGNPIFTLIAFIYVTAVAFLSYLAATLYGRDAQMALDIEQHAQTHSGNACAIVGGHHERGLIDRLIDSSNVQIIPQDD
jgi:hypothetical protein